MMHSVQVLLVNVGDIMFNYIPPYPIRPSSYLFDF